MIAVWYTWPLWVLALVAWGLICVLLAREVWYSTNWFYRLLVGAGLAVSVMFTTTLIEVA